MNAKIKATTIINTINIISFVLNCTRVPLLLLDGFLCSCDVPCKQEGKTAHLSASRQYGPSCGEFQPLVNHIRLPGI